MDNNIGNIAPQYKNANIGVLTYSIPHRKTYDILSLLKAKGYKNVIVYAIPLQYKKSFRPMLQHRPEMIWSIDVEEICNNFSYSYNEISSYVDIDGTDEEVMLVGGATLLPDTFIKKYQVINAHPGYIPNCRGLDAYKWAIYEKQPLGVTAHLIGDEVDAGEVILREMVQIYQHDTFYSVAQRLYENEIKILVEAIPYVLDNTKREYISGEGYIVHKRMPKDIEQQLLAAFEEYKINIMQR